MAVFGSGGRLANVEGADVAVVVLVVFVGFLLSFVLRVIVAVALFCKLLSVESSGRPSERIECLRSNRYESDMFIFKLPLKLLLRDMLEPPFKGFTDNKAVAVVLLLSSLSLKFKSVIDTAEGERCIDRETGMLVITSLASKLDELVVIVEYEGFCNLQFVKFVGNTAWANAAVFGCPGIKVLFDDELSISLIVLKIRDTIVKLIKNLKQILPFDISLSKDSLVTSGVGIRGRVFEVLTFKPFKRESTLRNFKAALTAMVAADAVENFVAVVVAAAAVEQYSWVILTRDWSKQNLNDCD
ncbi:hypothetical protein FF38_00010 [Lucilia cuprina]|uniref:Uncharacterized protein n=1 Tax=Lucilia cuprina TaxID=7375 RepID=A0A0L0CS15_LUCCU|nr:hypothetical protein FF38_00010 [Lucilia cuprina]